MRTIRQFPLLDGLLDSDAQRFPEWLHGRLAIATRLNVTAIDEYLLVDLVNALLRADTD